MHRHPLPSDAHLVIVGNGMAGHRLVEALAVRQNRPARITVIGEEAVPAYNRILLSPLLAGEMTHDELTLRDVNWYADHGIELILGERVIEIDRQSRCLTTDTGRSLDYHSLVLATGSRPAIPAIPGHELAGVRVFRELGDAEALTEAATGRGNAVVIGGGLLGLEAAEGLRKRGMHVTLIQRSDRLMNRQLDATAAGLLEGELNRRGLEVITGGHIAEFSDNGEGGVAGVLLEDGTWLSTDCVVVAIGIEPNLAPGRQAGLEVDRGIVVDDHLTTSDPSIHALGECCQFRGTTYGLVEPIWRQVEVLAPHLCGESVDGYTEVLSPTRLKVSGISLYAFGPTEADEGHEVLLYQDPEQGDYRRLLLRDGRIEGAILYGNTALGPWYFAQAQAERDLTSCRQALLLGAADAEALLDIHASTTRPQKEAA